MARKRNPLIWSHVRMNRRQRHSDLNITPIMNLFVVLIPVLLMSATFIELAIVHSAISETLKGEGQGKAEVKISPILEVRKKGYVLRSRTCDLQALFKQSKLKAGKGQVTIDQHDTQRLQELLRSMKALSPTETAISLAPESGTPYQLIIRTMDSVREWRSPSKVEPLFMNIAFVPDLMES